MKELSRRSFVKKSIAGSLAAANLAVFSGIVQASGGGGGQTTTVGTTTQPMTTLPFTTGFTTDFTSDYGSAIGCGDTGVTQNECCEINNKKVYKCTKNGTVVGYCDRNNVKSSSAKTHCENQP